MFTHDKSDKFEYPTFDAQGNPVKSSDGKPVTRTIEFVGAACIKCHGPTALGDGTTTDYDDWTKQIWTAAAWSQKSDPEASMLYALGALPERHITPRNLRLGVYRGGRRPLDFYYRIHEGINAAPMPATDVLTEAEKKQRDAIQKAADALCRKQHPDLRDHGRRVRRASKAEEAAEKGRVHRQNRGSPDREIAKRADLAPGRLRAVAAIRSRRRVGGRLPNIEHGKPPGTARAVSHGISG